MSQKTLPLSGVKVGEQVTVARLGATGSMRRRLLDIGLIEGTRVECLHRSPSGDPAAYAIRGAVIALRDCDSASVSVTPIS
ncbi:MAG: FeoA family protein [Candidatus Merdivicinus sp.]|jgi:ferrous iron transport protein A